MLDDDIKDVKSLTEIVKGLLDGRKEKYKEGEKQFCQQHQDIINEHLKECIICKASYQAYLDNHNIPMTPPCNLFTQQVKEHIEKCKTCEEAQRKWNEDSIPVTPKFRSLVSKLTKLERMVKK